MSLTTRSFVRSLPLALLAASAACAATSRDDADPESLGHVEAAALKELPARVNGIMLNLGLGVLDPAHCTFVVTNGNGIFTPSSALSSLLFGDPNGAAHTIPTPPIAPVSKSTWIGPIPVSFTASVTSLVLDMSSIHLDVAPDLDGVHGDITIDASLSGRLHVDVSSPFPSADLVLDRVSLHGALGWDPVAKQLTVKTVTADIADHITNCGLFDWCDGLYSALIPSTVGGEVGDAIRAQLGPQLTHPEVTAAFKTSLLQMWNASAGGGGQAQRIVDGTIQFAPAEIDFHVIQQTPPTAPVGCATRTVCSGEVEIACGTPNWDIVVLKRDVNDGRGFVELPYSGSSNAGMIDLYDYAAPGGGQTINYVLCAHNAIGEACSAPITVTTSGASCGGGGGGGTGYTGGPRPKTTIM